MAGYTVSIRTICRWKSGLNSVDCKSVDEIIDAATPNIFNFEWDFYDEAKKLNFEKKFLKHFYVREIAHETYDLWHLRLEDKLAMIMPYYNQLYKSAELEFNPLHDVDITTRHEGTDSSSGSSSATANNKSAYNDTPQGSLQDIESNEYLTSATINSGTSTSNSSSNGTDQYVHTVTGKQGVTSYSKMLTDYRNTILNIDAQVFAAMEPLFFQLW